MVALRRQSLRLRWWRRPDLVTLALFLVLAASLWAFIAIADEVTEGDSLAFDRMVLTALREPGDLSDPIGPQWVEEAVRAITGLGGSAVLTLITVATVGYLWLSGHRRMILFLLAAIGGGLLVSLALKAGFSRPRPEFLPHGQAVYTASFPSGHSMNSAIVYLTLGAILARAQTRRALKSYFLALGILLTALVGFSRLYLGLHWPTDVLAGWTAGAGWAVLCGLVALALQRRRVIEQARGKDQEEDESGGFDSAPPQTTRLRARP
jgi:undecaprenyl-diphosphatase